ncbi:MAG: DUF5666 domain-containing protein [Pyrinomonadaceae bacterium]
MYKSFLTAIVTLFAVSFVFSQAKLPDIGIEKGLVVGEVKIVGDQKLVVETKDGSIDAILLNFTTYKLLPPDNLGLKAATDSEKSKIAVGDRVVITGTVAADKSQILSKTVYMVKGAALAAKQQEQQREWQTRGISGRVTAVDSTNKNFTVEMRSLTGTATSIKVVPKSDAEFLRYSNQSVRYDDATKSDFQAIKVEDMVHVLGDKNAANTEITAEKVLSGSFVTVAGTIKSVDAEKNQIVITDLKTNSDVTIDVVGTSMLKRFPEQAAQMMAASQMGGGGPQPPGGRRPQPKEGENGARNSSGEGQRRPGGGRNFDINEMLNRFPTIAVSELKPGEMIAVSSPKLADSTKFTAIRLLAGVEPFVRMAQMAAARSGNRNGVSGSLSIPGLDGVDF